MENALDKKGKLGEKENITPKVSTTVLTWILKEKMNTKVDYAKRWVADEVGPQLPK